MKMPLFEDFTSRFKDDIWNNVAETICRKHKIYFQRLRRTEHGENIVFLIDDSLVIKIYTPFRNGFRREKTALEFALGKPSLIIPEILFEGEIEGFNYLIMTQIKGNLITRETWLNLESSQQRSILSQLAYLLKELHSYEAGSIDFDWEKFIKHQLETVLERQQMNGASPEWLERLPFYLEENLSLLSPDFSLSLLHGDVHFGNLRLIETRGKWQISGLFDFGDCLKGFHEYEFVAIGVLMIPGQGELQREFFGSYGYKKSELDTTLRRRLMLLTILYECSNLRKYALWLKPEAFDFTLDELERAIWNFV